MNGNSARWQVEGIRSGWMITVFASASEKTLLADLPRLLRELEERGIHDFDPSLMDDGSLKDIADQLGIAGAWQSPDTSYPSSVYRTIEEPLERRAYFGGIRSPVSVESDQAFRSFRSP